MPPEAKPLWRIFGRRLLRANAAAQAGCASGWSLTLPCRCCCPPTQFHAPLPTPNALCPAVTGTRNYTCQTQTLSFGPSLGVGNITGQLANGTAFTCDWFYNSAFSAMVACRTNGSTEEFGYSLDTTVRGAGAPHTAALCWGFRGPPRQCCGCRAVRAVCARPPDRLRTFWASPHGAGHPMRHSVKVTLQAFTFVASPIFCGLKPMRHPRWPPARSVCAARAQRRRRALGPLQDLLHVSSGLQAT